MTVVLRQNETLELNLVEYAGVITADQLKAVAAYGAQHPDFLKSDALNIVREDAEFAVDLKALDAMFMRYSALYAPLNFQIFRRAAWLCFSKAADAHVTYWVCGHDLRGAMSSAVRKFDTLAEAGDWLLLSATEIAQVERGEGFEELAAFGHAAPVMALQRG